MCITNSFIKFGPLCCKAHWFSGRTLALGATDSGFDSRMCLQQLLQQFLPICFEKFIGCFV